MDKSLPLHGIRINLSGAIPDDALPENAEGIRSFVQVFAQRVFNEGGTIIHGSHPTFKLPLEAAAKRYIEAGGEKDSLTFVRAQKFSITAEELNEVESERKYAAVHIIPAVYGHPEESLVPMREWMAERCDMVIALGGKWYDINKSNAGVPAELEETLLRGKPGFVVAGFGGAIEGYKNDHKDIFSRLQNGLSRDQNESLSKSTNVELLVNSIVSQIKLLPVAREKVSRGRLFRILALDGGGLRGTFTAAVLAKWDDMIKSGGGNDIVKHFDLVAGTSTGAILAIGLGLGLSPKDMLDFYRKEGPKIFPKNRKLRHWLKSKHDAYTLRATLRSAFGGKILSKDSCCRLVIPTVRAIHGEAETIVTAHTPERTAFKSFAAVDAALASAAAPTYFDEANVTSKIAIEKFLDGGIWANNPVLPAISEAVRYLKIPIDRIDVLSVGTMGSESDFRDSLGKGLAGWAPDSADLFFAAQESGAGILADNFLSSARYLRINQHAPSEIKLDDVKAIEDMAYRGMNVGNDSFAIVRSRFLDGFYAHDWRT
jgi:patatin-like phospholipase/acyl hydrolase